MVKSTFEKRGRYQPPKRGLPGLVVVGILSLAVLISWMAWEDFIIWVDGVPELSPQRKAKLQRELEELEEAEQYVLLAEKDGFFPCFACVRTKEVFLFRGEVWKYGVTRNGEKGRYKEGLPAEHLVYVIQFKGALQECLKREKLKIYYYPLLPENMKRGQPIARPPGNKRDI